MNIGFLIIDMQKAFLKDHMKEYGVDRAVEYINYVADLMRHGNQTIVHIQDIEGVVDLDQEDVQFIDEIKREATDLVVQKKVSNAFWETELEKILKERNIELVILSGFAAEYCVLFTYNGARERGFRPVLLQNGVVSEHRDTLGQMLRDRNFISYPVIEFLLDEAETREAGCSCEGGCCEA